MKIASWNVNSLKVRLPHVLEWLQLRQPDVLALQETKLTDENFPVTALNEAGYHIAFSGQKTYNGVAFLTRTEHGEVMTDPPGVTDAQRRILAITLGDIRLVNLYVVNGESIESEKYAYKLDWLRRVTDWLEQEARQFPKMVVMGDFNIAPDDRDVHDPLAAQGEILCSNAEREALKKLLNLGLSDCFRKHQNEGGHYSWFDYRAASFRRNRGFRIDLILASQALQDVCVSSTIDLEPRGWERPSDHTPVIAEFRDQESGP